MKYLLLSFVLFSCTSPVIKVECRELQTNRTITLLARKGDLQHSGYFWKHTVFKQGQWVCARR